MKNFVLCLLCLVLFSLFAHSQQSRVFDKLSMESTILNMTRNYAVYLPAGYDESERSYPVLYLLHGSGDDQTGWIQFGEVQHIADRAIAAGTATAVIIIMPDANTGQRGYFNDVNNEWRYEDFFLRSCFLLLSRNTGLKRRNDTGRLRVFPWEAVAPFSMPCTVRICFPPHAL